MKLTQKLIDQIQEAMLHTKKDGSINWKDDDDVVVQLAGTFAADRFIVIKNRTKDPVVSAEPHPHFDYEKKVFTKDGRDCLLYTSPSPRDQVVSRMPSSA